MSLSKRCARSGLAAAIIALCAAPQARADGTMIPGGTVGASLYKSGSSDLFAMFIGSQAQYSDDLYFYLTIGGAPQPLFNNHTGVAGQTIDITSSAGLATGSEAIFSICANLGAGTPCTSEPSDVAGEQYFSGSSSRNSDGLYHAAVWTRADWLAGCTLVPSSCTAAGVAAVMADPSYDLIVGFEDSFDDNVDHDFNDIIFGVRGATTTTPEPVTMSLLATGLVGMGGVTTLKRRKKA
jgi:hypothetical protein